VAVESLMEMVETLQNILIAHATGSHHPRSDDYLSLRANLLSNPRTKPALPSFVRESRDLGQFWQFIKLEFGTYAERREYLWNQFRPLREALEFASESPVKLSDSALLSRLSAEAVQEVWQRALDRRTSDPEGAITSARGLLESACKHILDELTVPYPDNAELPKLYGLTANALQIAPSQHTEPVFKQILGGCTAVVEGLGALRNRLGDAHGGGLRKVKPAARHAQLAVNLAGAMTAYLVETWEARKKAAP
jgi:hypothetical protein